MDVFTNDEETLESLMAIIDSTEWGRRPRLVSLRKATSFYQWEGVT